MEIATLYEEINGYYLEIENLDDGEHLIDRYKKVVDIMIRVAHIRSEIAYREVIGKADAPEKKFRTMILDPFIERLQEMARYESRAITAKEIEAKMER